METKEFDTNKLYVRKETDINNLQNLVIYNPCFVKNEATGVDDLALDRFYFEEIGPENNKIFSTDGNLHFGENNDEYVEYKEIKQWVIIGNGGCSLVEIKTSYKELEQQVNRFATNQITYMTKLDKKQQQLDLAIEGLKDIALDTGTPYSTRAIETLEAINKVGGQNG